MAEREIVTAEVITAPVIEAQLLGEKRELRFDNRAAMLAERYWRETTGQRISYFFILGELDARTYGGALAVAYGAMASAVMHRNESRRAPEPVLSCRAFEHDVRMDEILVIMDEMRRAVNDSLPKAPKNAESPAKSGADGPGTGS
jgi:hypothetical protein